MKLGILSDTHGNLPAAEIAARRMADAGVAAVFHCGDIGGFDVLTELAAVFQPRGVPVHAVLGNVDHYSGEWNYFPSNLGIHLPGRFGDITLGGKRMALLHGDDVKRFQSTVNNGHYDLVFSGHSHEVHDYTVGPTRCINPGTTGRGSPNTCAVLCLESGDLIIHRF